MACLGGSVEDNEQYSTFVEPLSGSGGDYIRSLVILSLEPFAESLRQRDFAVLEISYQLGTSPLSVG